MSSEGKNLAKENITWEVKGHSIKLNTNSENFDPCEVLKVRDNANAWEILEVLEWYPIYDFFPQDVKRIIYHFKNKIPEFLWMSSCDYKKPWVIRKATNKDNNNPTVVSNQLHLEYDVRIQWTT